MKRVLLAGAGGLFLLPLVVVAAAVSSFQAVADGQPSDAALADIPPAYLRLYQQAAATCPGLSWALLAAVGKVESDHGRNVSVSPAGAVGPMQFLPSTWAVYGRDGDGDGVADPNDPADAIFGAANYLCHNGGGDPAALSGAIFAYNHSDAYVQEVLGWYHAYLAPSGPVLTAAGGAPSPAAAAALQWAATQLGKPYQWGGCGPDAWDCSCLVQHAYAAGGVALPRTTTEQYAASGPHVDPAALSPGDLVFFGTPADVHHVGLYVGDGEMLDAPDTGAVVRVEPLFADYLGATRPAP
ncbi:MAG: bifunctional lytic transglycosylase/C40 family peptidase [Acidimicrobiia bacterium]|nr:bifunctional lytic transglycosylase/C40 family peptidase [Acidimicrobiia bacterium]